MSSKDQTPRNDKASSKHSKQKPAPENFDTLPGQQTYLTPIIRQAMFDPGRLTPKNTLQLQRTVGNQAVNRLLNKDVQPRMVVQSQQVKAPAGNNVIQRTLYSAVKQKADTNQAIAEQDIEDATREFLVEMLRDQGYKDADGNPVGPTEMQNVAFMWDEDYGAVPGLVQLPSKRAVIEDIKTGVFKMALRHEMGHYIRSIEKEGNNDTFQDVENIINGVNWSRLKRDYPQGDMENWKEEVRADLKSIRLRYLEEKRFPTDSELRSYQAMLGLAVDNAHPPAAFRVKMMKRFISRIKPSKFCYLTTACTAAKGLPDDCEELTLLRHFRDSYLLNKPNGEQLVELYYRYSPEIVEKIEQDPQKDVIYEGIYRILRDCVDAIKREEMEETYLKYCEMVVKLKELFIPEERIPAYEI
jgi:hypothetical protein